VLDVLLLYLLAYLIHTCNLLYIVSFDVKHRLLEGKCGAVVKSRKINQEGAGSNLPMVVLLLKLSRNVEEVRYL